MNSAYGVSDLNLNSGLISLCVCLERIFSVLFAPCYVEFQLQPVRRKTAFWLPRTGPSSRMRAFEVHNA